MDRACVPKAAANSIAVLTVRVFPVKPLMPEMLTMGFSDN
jgi:hypothetical protein